MNQQPVAAAPPLRRRQPAFIIPSAARWMIILSLFFAISKVQNQLGVLVKMRVVLLLMVGVLLFLIFNTHRWRPSDLMKQNIPRAVMLIFGIAIIGIPFGIGPGRSFHFLKDYIATALAVAVAGWAVAKTLRGTILLTKTITIAGVAVWAFALFHGRLDSSGRLSGAFAYDANDLGLIINVTIPLLLWWAVEQKNRWRWVALGLIPLFGYAMILTGSRGGFLGTVAVLVGFAGLSFQKVPKKVRKVALAAAICGVAAVPILPGSYIERMSTILEPEDDYNMNSATGRWQVWQRGIGYAKDSPLFGVGIDNFGWAEGTISEMARNRDPDRGIKFSAAHNAYIQVLAELGFIAGSTFFVLLIGTPLALVFAHRGKGARALPPDEIDTLAPFVALSFIGFAVTAFFLSFAYYDILYVLLGLATAILGHKKKRLDMAKRSARARGQQRRVVQSAVRVA